MGWNSKLLKIIQTWFGCTDNNAQHAFMKLGFNYHLKETHLGFEGNLDAVNANIKIVLSYTVRDGIFVNIKVLNPWKVLFEYVDGAYFVNDQNAERFDKIIKSLKDLQTQNDQGNYRRIYAQMETIVLKHLLEYTSCASKRHYNLKDNDLPKQIQ